LFIRVYHSAGITYSHIPDVTVVNTKCGAMYQIDSLSVMTGLVWLHLLASYVLNQNTGVSRETNLLLFQPQQANLSVCRLGEFLSNMYLTLFEKRVLFLKKTHK
jgi:hypothetical protein